MIEPAATAPYTMFQKHNIVIRIVLRCFCSAAHVVHNFFNTQSAPMLYTIHTIQLRHCHPLLHYYTHYSRSALGG